MRAVILLIAVLTIATGCGASYTAARKYEFPNSQEYNQTKAQTWGKLMQYVSTSFVPIKHLEREDGFLATEFMPVKSLRFCDCGSISGRGIEPVTLTADIMRFNVVVADAPGGGSRVTVSTEYHYLSAMHTFAPGDYRTSTHECESTGEFEKDFLEKLK